MSAEWRGHVERPYNTQLKLTRPSRSFWRPQWEVPKSSPPPPQWEAGQLSRESLASGRSTN